MCEGSTGRNRCKKDSRTQIRTRKEELKKRSKAKLSQSIFQLIKEIFKRHRKA